MSEINPQKKIRYPRIPLQTEEDIRIEKGKL